MTDKEKIIQEIERRIHFLDGMVNTDFGRGSLDTLNKVLNFINSLPAEQPNFKVEFAGKEYEVVRVRELSNGTTMYGILDEPNHIDYINKDNCRLVKPSEDLEKEIDRVIKEVVTPETLQDYIMGFKAGAQWQKEQMMKSAIDAVIINDEMSGCVVDCEQGCLVLEPNTYPIGQKLKILILEDEQ